MNRKTLDNENADTIKNFYFNHWNRNLDEYRIELYKSLHSIYKSLQEISLKVPEKDWIIELGVNRCESFNVLCEMFGKSRCRGFDLENVTKNPLVRCCDIRKFDEIIPTALCVNEIGGWKVTPESRRAAFDWAVKNIVSGGLLIEHSDELAEWSLSQKVNEHNFRLVLKTKLHAVYSKI